MISPRFDQGTALLYQNHGTPPESEMNPRTSFATHHPQDSAYGPPHLVLEHLAAMANARRTGRYLRIPCPAHGGTNPNLALWVDGDSIGAKGHSAGCSYPDITAPIADRFGLSIARSQHERWPSRWSPASPPLSQLPHHLPASAPRPTPYGSHSSPPPSPNPETIPRGGGWAHTIYGDRSSPSPLQSGGPEPSISTATSRDPGPSAP